MKFKVGDKVKIVKCHTMGSNCPHLGEIGIITKIQTNLDYPYSLNIDKNEQWCDDELEIVKEKQFTKSDLKDGDIVTYRYGDRRTLIKETFECNDFGKSTSVLEHYNEDLTMKNGNKKMDIIKVERPVQYETVFERKEEILDKAEKRWLSNFIKSTEIEVKYIKKWVGASGENEYLEISYMNYYDKNNILFLPIFKRNTKYKGMAKGKEYTLEELRIIGE